MSGRPLNILLAMLFVLMLIAPSLSIRASAATVIVDPINSVPRQGGYLILTILGFPANSTLYILLDNGTLLGVTVTDKLGSAQANVSVPMHVWPGTHEVVVVYANGSTLVVAKDTVTIEPAPVEQYYKMEIRTGGYATTGEEVIFYVLVKKSPEETPVDPQNLQCTLFSPTGSTSSVSTTRINTGFYKGSFTPTENGTYGLYCEATMDILGGPTISSIAAIHVSPLANVILNTLINKYSALSDLINSTRSTLLSKISVAEANLSDLINSSAYTIIAKVKVSEDNVTTRIISNISRANQSILLAISSANQSILQAINAAYDSLNQSIAGAVGNVSNLTVLIKKLYANITVFIERNATRIIQKIGEAEDNVTREIQLQAQYLANLLTAYNESLYLLVKSESGDIQALVKTKVSKAEQNLSASLDSISSSIAQLIALVQQSNQSIHVFIANKTGELMAYINQSCLEKLGNLTITLQANVTDLINDRYMRIMENINSTRSQLSALIVSNAGNIVGLINGLGNKIDSRYELLADMIASANQSLHVLITSDIDDVLQAIANAVEEARGMNQSLHSLIREKAAEILGSLSDKYGDLYGLVSDVNATIITRIDSAESFLAGAIQAAKQGLEENMTLKIEATRDAILLSIGDTRSDVLAAIASANQSIQALVVDEADRVVGSVAAARTILGALVLNATGRLEANLSALIADRSGRVLYEINMTGARITSIIINQSGDILANITNGTISLLARIGRLETNLTGLITGSTSRLEAGLGRVNASLRALIDGRVVELRGELIAALNNSQARVLEELAGAERRLNATITNMHLDLGASITGLSAQLENSTARLESIIITSSGEVLAAVNASNKTIILRLGNIEGLIEQLSQSVSESAAKMLASLASTESNITSRIRESAEEVKSIASNYGVSSTTASVITLLAVSGLAIFMRRT